MSDQTQLQLEQSNRVLATEIAYLARVTRAALPQWLDLATLCTRYALDAHQVRAQIQAHQLRSEPHGRGLRMHIDDVLRLDELLEPKTARSA